MNKLLVCLTIVSLLFAGCSSNNSNDQYIPDEEILKEKEKHLISQIQ